ncbi:MAG: GNAT family N-acetyltransferase [Rhodobiaceae bacterium]|nr:GNAT family N-acetyltransferase [Rhodobiaceae bacterium]
MVAVDTTIRAASAGDTEDLAQLYLEAWHGAYRGIIAPLALERMMARRGNAWWRRAITARSENLLVISFDGVLVGYASLGPARRPIGGLRGEIYELYLRPVYQGIGFGTRLFEAARRRLDAAGLGGHLVWALRENEQACAFYLAKGGTVATSVNERLGGQTLRKIAFTWR